VTYLGHKPECGRREAQPYNASLTFFDMPGILLGYCKLPTANWKLAAPGRAALAVTPAMAPVTTPAAAPAMAPVLAPAMTPAMAPVMTPATTVTLGPALIISATFG